MRWPLEELRDWANKSMGRLDRVIALLERAVDLLDQAREDQEQTYYYDEGEDNGN